MVRESISLTNLTTGLPREPSFNRAEISSAVKGLLK